MSAFATLLDAMPRYVGLLRSQYWPAERLHAYREEHLTRTLAAAVRIPFYADRLGDGARIEEFRRLPILRRQDVESLHRSARLLYPPDRQFAHSTSSGTVGPRAEHMFDRSHQRGRHAARARYLRANGWNPIERTAWLAGGRFLNSDEMGNEDKQFVTRLLVGVRFFSNSIELPLLADAIAKLDPVFIYLYPSILDGLIRTFEHQRQRLPSLRRVFTGGEVLDVSLRERTWHQFGVQIADNYGSTEGFLSWQCPAGNYHQNAEHVLIEIVDDAGREVAAGQMGRVLVTTLENYLMPLVRYEIGDYAVAMNGACACGRTLPLMGAVVGRGMNLFRATDGRLIGTWDLVNTLRLVPEMATFQIVQKALDRILIKYVSEVPISSDIEGKIGSEFAQYIGSGFSIEFERTSDIARTPGGKFMLTLSEVSA